MKNNESSMKAMRIMFDSLFPSLSRERILVWLVRLDKPANEVLDTDYLLLDDSEKTRADRFKFEKDRVSFIISHAALRKVLAHYLNQPADQIHFIYNEYEKPSLSPAYQSDITFNLSHSGHYALIALSRVDPVGVDVEIMRDTRDLDEIAERFFSQNEVMDYQSLPQADRVLGFYQAWTRKEAFIKAIGSGLYHSLHAFSVSLKPNEPAMIKHIDDHSVEQWQLFSWIPAEGFCAAVAIESEVSKSLHCLNYSSSTQ